MLHDYQCPESEATWSEQRTYHYLILKGSKAGHFTASLDYVY